MKQDTNNLVCASSKSTQRGPILLDGQILGLEWEIQGAMITARQMTYPFRTVAVAGTEREMLNKVSRYLRAELESP